MTDATNDVAQLKALVDQLQQRVDQLEARINEQHPEGTIPEEVLMAISAACAAYLGKRAVIKQIHHRRPRNWANQGRRAIHTSHSTI